MSYSVAEAKVTEVMEAVSMAHKRLQALRVEAKRIGDKLDSAVSGAAPIAAEIDAGAPITPLWSRLKDKKDQVVADLSAVRSTASAILESIEAELDG